MRRHEAGRRRVRCGAGHPEKQAQVIDRPPQSLVMPVLLLFVALLVPRCAFAQQGVRPGDGRKRAQAVRVPSGSIDVNGRLDDSAWRDVPALTEFVQKEPVEGGTPTDRMEVRFAYDDRALYVGARMYSTDPIRSPLGRRDDGDQAEHLIVSLDPYLDRRTASTFGVTAAGVRLDRFYPQDDDFPSDAGFNPVWRARTSIDQAGWTAELWIPFSQLRFTDRDPQVWGLNVQRFVPSQNEEVFWALIPRTEERWTSLFGDLHGIAGIKPTRRLELLPYAANTSTLVGAADTGAAFSRVNSVQGRIGLDAKVGLGSNLTLDATVNPDFGQVEADPAEVNLTAFETFFTERRPFFVEGSQLLNGRVNNYFYSRRIGAVPNVTDPDDFVEYPLTATILGAAKLTGRQASGRSIGMLAAVTGEEWARNPASGFARERVAPRTAYGVARVQQEFGAPGSLVAVMATAVHRDFDATDPLASLLARNAITLSTDSTLRLKDGEYEAQLYAGMTRVAGEAAAVNRIQRASQRYLQRPDADYVHYDPTRRSMTGGKSGAVFERRNGRRWLWQTETLWEFPEFDPTDIGRSTTTDGVIARGFLEYRDTQPGRWRRNYAFRATTTNEWNFGRIAQGHSLQPRALVTWPNFWETQVTVFLNARVQNQSLTRGGPSMEKPRSWRTDLRIQNSGAAQTRGTLQGVYGRDEDGGLTLQANTTFTAQPNPQWQLSVRPAYEREVNTQQYVTTLPGGGLETFGSRYVFAHIDRSTYSTQIRMNYTFRPDLTLDFYGEPFAASGRYDHIGELAKAGTRLIHRYGTDGTVSVPPNAGQQFVTDGASVFVIPSKDFRVQSFRSNLVLRWEWRPGSTLYLVWQQDRASEDMLRSRASVADMFESVGQRGDNYIVVKASFWFSPS